MSGARRGENARVPGPSAALVGEGLDLQPEVLPRQTPSGLRLPDGVTPYPETGNQLVESRPTMGLGVTSLVSGLLGLPLAPTPLMAWLSGGLACVSGGIFLSRPRLEAGSGPGMAITGVILGLAAIIFSLIVVPWNYFFGPDSSDSHLFIVKLFS